jgi:hypothetical protein
VDRLRSQVRFGASTLALDTALEAPAVLPNVRPPLPAELKQPPTDKRRDKTAQTLASRSERSSINAPLRRCST